MKFSSLIYDVENTKVESPNLETTINKILSSTFIKDFQKISLLSHIILLDNHNSKRLIEKILVLSHKKINISATLSILHELIIGKYLDKYKILTKLFNKESINKKLISSFIKNINNIDIKIY